jgi:hypothetical protein
MEAAVRWWPFVVCSACTFSYGPDQVDAEVLCVTTEGDEVCAPAVATRVDADGAARFEVSAVARLSGVDFGWELAEATISGELPAGAALPATLDALVAIVPARVTCVVDEAHGDHCHLGIAYDQACALTVGELRRVTIDRLDDEGIALRFDGVSTSDVPACCVSTCVEADRPAWTDPPLPYRIAGAARARWSAGR